MINYYIESTNDPRWVAIWQEIGSIPEYSGAEPLVVLNHFLAKYKGKVIAYKGIEFESEADLVYFKLKFN